VIVPKRRPPYVLAASLAVVLFVTGLFAAPVTPAARMAEFNLEEATIADITSAFNAGALTCQRLAQLYLNRINTYDPGLHSMILVNPRLLETAAALDQERRTSGPRGPLHCIPVVLKDNFDTFDMPTTNGSAVMRNAIPPADGYVTRVIRESGALIVGKAAMGEFAGASYNTVVGYPVNPYHRLRDTGASSSGSGSAVAANFAVLSVGTDTSTSVRSPAATNGIVGLRPTTGVISRAGIAPKNLTFDSAGPLARTVTDLATFMNVIAGPDPNDPDGVSMRVFSQYPDLVGVDYTRFLQRGSLRGARLGVARQYWGGDPEMDALADAAIAKMRELGAEIVDPVTIDPQAAEDFPIIRAIADYRFREDWEAYLATFGPEVPKTVQEFLDIYRNEIAYSEFPPAESVLGLLERSLPVSSRDGAYQTLIRYVLPRLTELRLAPYREYNLDAIVFPYNPTFASPIATPVYTADDPSFVRSTVLSPATVATYGSEGFPGIVVPMGFGTQGLPAAISFMGKPGDDGKMIAYAFDYEQATMHRRPSPLVPPLPGERIAY
jgi:amidase